MNDRLYTVNNLMQLGLSRDKAYELMHSKAFPAIKIGGRYYVPQSAWEMWLSKYAGKEFIVA